MPEEIELLPKPERLHGCAVAEGGEHASSMGKAGMAFTDDPSSPK
jgi:hypothetical protein